MYFIFCLLSLNPLLSSLFSRAFLYDHKNRKCQWLSFDRNSPGVLSQQDFNYQLYQKKGALHSSTFSFHQLVLKLHLLLPLYHLIQKKKKICAKPHFQSTTLLQYKLLVALQYVGGYNNYKYSFSRVILV